MASNKLHRPRMNHKKIAMHADKKIALVAHDHKKADLLAWAKFNRDLLARPRVCGTCTTGAALERELGFEIERLQSGPLGGDQQIGSKIVDNEIDFLIFSGTRSPGQGIKDEGPGFLSTKERRDRRERNRKTRAFDFT